MTPTARNGLLVIFAALLVVSSSWAASKYKVLYNFKGGDDAEAPLYGAPVFDQYGNLFGTAGGGGYNYQCGGWCGTAYEMSPEANGKWKESVIFRFQPTGTGYPPFAGVIVDHEENVYGTTSQGGGFNDGTVFSLAPGGPVWTESILYSFGSQENDAGAPFSGLTPDGSGNLYGAAFYPYELTPVSGNGWTEQVLYRFHTQYHKDGTDGEDSDVPLILDAHGNLYGTTAHGGNYSLCQEFQAGCGTVFELSPQSDGTWKEYVLHRFAQFKDDGAWPFLEGVVMDPQGILYGATSAGGKYGSGTIYKLTPGKNGHWKETILFDFPTVEDGGGPLGVTLDSKGNLYGTAGGGGGGCSCGVVFKLAHTANGKWKYTVLHTFQGTDGGVPYAGVTLDAKGNIFGTTDWGGKYLLGVVFEITQ